MRYLCACFPVKIKVGFIMFVCNVGSGKIWNPSGCSAWLKFKISDFPFRFHNQNTATNTFLCRAFNETPDVHKALGTSLPTSGAPGHVGDTKGHKTDPSAEDWWRNGSQIPERSQPGLHPGGFSALSESQLFPCDVTEPGNAGATSGGTSGVVGQGPRAGVQGPR